MSHSSCIHRSKGIKGHSSASRRVGASLRALVWSVAPMLAFVASFSFPSAQASAASRAQRQCARTFENAQEQALDGKLVEAAEMFEGCAQRHCGRALKRECTRALRRIRRDLPTVILSFRSHDGEQMDDVRVMMDGSPLTESIDDSAIPVNPGFHTFAFETTDGRRVEKLQTVRRGDKELPILAEAEGPPAPAPSEQAASAATAPETIDMEFEEQPELSESSGSLAPYIVAGASIVVGVGAFIGLRVLANSKYADLPKCYPDCSLSQIEEVQTFYTASNLSLVAAAAGTGVGAVMWWLQQGDDEAPAEPEQTASVRPFVTPTRGGVYAGVGASF